MKHKWMILAPACHDAFGYKECVLRFVMGEATERDKEIMRVIGQLTVRPEISYAVIINVGLRRSLDRMGCVFEWDSQNRRYITPLVIRIQRWWRVRRKLHAAAEFLAHPSSDYQQLVNCGRPAELGQYGIRIRIEIPGEPLKEWKQLDSLLASGFSLEQIFGRPPTPAGSTSTKRTKTRRKSTRPRRRLDASNGP